MKNKNIDFINDPDKDVDDDVDEDVDDNIYNHVKRTLYTNITTKKIKRNNFKIVDLCAGTGAFSHVFLHNKLNINCSVSYANDFCPNSEIMYNLNHSSQDHMPGQNTHLKMIRKDIHDIELDELDDFDILCSGFPCQPFSLAGKKLGFKDKRSNVFWKILEILENFKPQIVILENVKNLQSHDDGKTFTTIYNSLVNLGYYVKFQILNTCKITKVPQNRERIYIVCFTDKKLFNKFNFDFPEVKCDPIKNFLEQNIPDKYYYDDRFSVYDSIKKEITTVNENVIYQYRRYYVRENKNKICPTLTANMGSGGHNVPLLRDNKGIRKLTPRECFNLQGFPSNYLLPNISDSGLYKLAGNAVSIPVIQLVINKILGLFNDPI